MNIIREIREVRQGTISIDVPAALLHRTVEIIVIPLDEVGGGTGREGQKGWPPGFLENTAGSLADDPIQRGPQGDIEPRRDLA
jgi:hypothetical protein